MWSLHFLTWKLGIIKCLPGVLGGKDELHLMGEASRGPLCQGSSDLLRPVSFWADGGWVGRVNGGPAEETFLLWPALSLVFASFGHWAGEGMSLRFWVRPVSPRGRQLFLLRAGGWGFPNSSSGCFY